MIFFILQVEVYVRLLLYLPKRVSFYMLYTLRELKHIMDAFLLLENIRHH